MSCFLCGAPWHPATGGLYGHQRTKFCGACSRSMVAMVKEQQGRWFWPHATLPPPARTMRFRFNLWPPTPTERPFWFQTPIVETEGVNVEDAFQKVSIPEGSRLLCYFEVRA